MNRMISSKSRVLAEESFAYYDYYFPREVWILIFHFVPFPSLIRLGAVSKYWRELTTLSVTSFNGFESVGGWLTDNVLKRFVSLESLYTGRTEEGENFVHSYSNMVLHDAGFVGLTNLKTLYLVNQRNITSTCLGSLTTLTDVQLHPNCWIDDVGISGLINLTSLRPARSMTNVGLQQLTNLLLLDLRGNQGINCDGIQHLTNLTSLHFHYLQTHTLAINSEDAVKGLTRLTELSLSRWVRLSNIVLSELTNLTSLNLTHNMVIGDDCMAGLVHLRRLTLAHTEQVTNDGVSGLTNLTFLDLSYNLHISDAALALLTNLTSLTLGNTSMVTNVGLAPLTKLRSLLLLRVIGAMNGSISGNGLSVLTNLTELDLSAVCIIADNTLTCLTNLKILNFDY
jgi:hypothetical protein